MSRRQPPTGTCLTCRLPIVETVDRRLRATWVHAEGGAGYDHQPVPGPPFDVGDRVILGGCVYAATSKPAPEREYGVVRVTTLTSRRYLVRLSTVPHMTVYVDQAGSPAPDGQHWTLRHATPKVGS